MYQAKHEMIIEELGLTMTQQKQFMPLYEQMEREIYQVNRNARALASEVEKKKNPSDRDYEAAASALSNTRIQEGDIEAKYFEKFSKILTKKQLFQLKLAEGKFTREMLSKKKRENDDLHSHQGRQNILFRHIPVILAELFLPIFFDI